MKKIMDVITGKERAFYGSTDTEFTNITTAGEEDGESAFKENQHIEVKNSNLNLRYPFWHDIDLKVSNCILAETARAALWYSQKIEVSSTTMKGVKALRECSDISIISSHMDSEEFGWCSKNITIKDSTINSVYAFMRSDNIDLSNVSFKGKYSFQYTKNIMINNSLLDTKDAFWHSKNVIVKDSTVKGEYLAWYAEDITFVNCKIIGTQPLCYTKNVKLINCEMIDCDLSFEYSSVEAELDGTIVSIKNPLKGKIVCDSIGEIIFDEFRRDKAHDVVIIERKKE